MAAPFQLDLAETLDSYAVMPSKQLNLGWTVTSLFYTGAFFLGLLLVAITLIVLLAKPEYRNGSESRSGIVALAWVGFGLMLFGVWSTVGSFYSIVQKINMDIRIKKGCSFFNPETPMNAIEKLAADATLADNVRVRVARQKNKVQFSSEADDYENPDYASAVIPINEDGIVGAPGGTPGGGSPSRPGGIGPQYGGTPPINVTIGGSGASPGLRFDPSTQSYVPA